MPRVQRGKVAAISTRWTRRVAASCRPLPQQLLPASAAGGGRRRCTFFSLLRFEDSSAAAAAAPRGGAGCALSVTFGDTLSPFCRCATSSPDRGKSFKGRGKKHSLHSLGSPFGRAGAKRLRGFVSQLTRCSPQGSECQQMPSAVTTFPVKKRIRKIRRFFKFSN